MVLFLAIATTQDRRESNEDINRVHVDADWLIDRVEMQAVLGLLHYLLRVVQKEHAEENQSSVNRHRVQAQAQLRSRWQESTANWRSEHNAQADRQWPAHIQELFARCSGSNKTEATDDACGVPGCFQHDRAAK